MATSWMMIRDRLVIDATRAAAIKEYTERNALQRGSTIVIAARSIEIKADLHLDNFDLILVADRFDGANGIIRLRNTEPAGLGEAGKPGWSVTVLARAITGVRIETAGGVGGKGLPGAAGKDGKEGIEAPGGQNGGNGADGGKGQTGGTGGQGGPISIAFEQDAVPGGIAGPGTLISSPSGEGGPGGDGGPGGRGGEPATWCKPNGTFCVDGNSPLKIGS
jgi:hypothetical protein